MKFYGFEKIGSSHVRCQDYTLTDAASEIAIFSDGCSQFPHTDVGARLLAHATLSNFKADNGLGFDRLYNRAVFDACQAYVLDPSNMHATLGVIIQQENVSHLYLQGDGYLFGIVEENGVTNGVLYHVSCDHDGNSAPFYPIYNLKGNFSKIPYLAQYPFKTVNKYFISETGESSLSMTHEIPSDELFHVKLTDFSIVGGFSDGLGTFTEKSDVQVFAEFCKGNLNGDFISRIYNNYLVKKLQLSHYDDFSVAYINNMQ